MTDDQRWLKYADSPLVPDDVKSSAKLRSTVAQLEYFLQKINNKRDQ